MAAGGRVGGPASADTKVGSLHVKVAGIGVCIRLFCSKGWQKRVLFSTNS
jgi:energy-converting hydrogenase Eha subunit E